MVTLTDALGRSHQRFDSRPRIVSLVPSLTELICDLGLADCLVGRTGFCVHPRETLRSIPKVGGTKDVKLDVVQALAPTHVIADMDENRREAVETLMALVPHVIVVHPKTVDDNLDLYALLGGIFGRAAEASKLAAAFVAARRELATACAALPRQTVLYPIWREPWMTVRRDTYIAAMLGAAGWDTLPAQATVRFPEFSWDEPWLADIERVLLPSEPYAFGDGDAAELRALTQRAVTRVDGEMLSWYGSRAIAGLSYLSELRRQLS
ncbi:MAG: helical backbone metal receptor [Burkholderiaceae bacterium]|nr:helical backbone metal receptor [Burkholderiaceae bacterium]MCF8183550.1 helical backbone metal receptor [Polynucleobacter sp.]